MSRNLVVLFVSEFYDYFALEFTKCMINPTTGQSPQMLWRHHVPLPPIVPQKPTRKASKLPKLPKFMKRKSQVQEIKLHDPRAVAGAYTFLTDNYLPGDKIVVLGVSGVEADLPVIQASVVELVKHLDAGTSPDILPSSSVPGPNGDLWPIDLPGERDHLFGHQIGAHCAALLHRTIDVDIGSFNDQLLEQLPLSVRHAFSFNWASERESWCYDTRGPSGQLKSREICRYEKIGWHVPLIINSTMRFIRYGTKFTSCWASIAPTGSILLPALSAPIAVPAGFALPAPSSPSILPAQRLMPSPSSTISSYMSELGSFTGTVSTAITSLHSSTDSIALDLPTDEDIRPAGMTRQEMFKYPAFGGRRDSSYLPARVVCKASRV